MQAGKKPHCNFQSYHYLGNINMTRFNKKTICTTHVIVVCINNPDFIYFMYVSLLIVSNKPVIRLQWADKLRVALIGLCALWNSKLKKKKNARSFKTFKAGSL